MCHICGTTYVSHMCHICVTYVLTYVPHMCHICEICGQAEVRKFWVDLANMNFKCIYHVKDATLHCEGITSLKSNIYSLTIIIEHGLIVGIDDVVWK